MTDATTAGDRSPTSASTPEAAIAQTIVKFWHDPNDPGAADWLAALRTTGWTLKPIEAEAATADLSPVVLARLVDGLAYALVRAALPTDEETSRHYATRLAPLVIESGYLAESEGQ